MGLTASVWDIILSLHYLSVSTTSRALVCMDYHDGHYIQVTYDTVTERSK
jgi:hypothetical protein